jgi:hypothetical protein
MINIVYLEDKTFKYQEIKFKDFRELNKCLLGDQLPTKTVLLNINQLLEACILDNNKTEIIKNLNFLDYIKFLLLVRSFSIGDTIQLKLKNSEIKNFSLNLNLDKILIFLETIDTKEILQSSIFEENNITIDYKLPTIQDIQNLEKTPNTYIYNFFIKNLHVNNTITEFDKISFDNQVLILQQLPAKYFAIITKNIHKIINTFYNINFFDPVYNPEHFNNKLPLIPNIDVICYIIKLLFSEVHKEDAKNILLIIEFQTE